MNNELKTKWTEALRSGKYLQTQGQLRAPWDAYCCLGVLCDVYDPKGWNVATNEFKVDAAYGLRSLSEELRNIFSLARFAHEKLIQLNDNNVPFDRIADWIDENV